MFGTSNTPVVVEDDGDARREERVEARLVEGMRVVAGGSEDEEIDDVDDTDTEVGAKVTAEESRSLDDLLGELETDADEDDVRLDTLVDRVLCRDGKYERLNKLFRDRMADLLSQTMAPATHDSSASSLVR